MDLSALNRIKQNILSIGENISVWSVGNDGYYNLHFYYPNAVAHDHKLRFSAVIGEKVNGLTRRTMGIVEIADESDVTIRFDKYGFWIDGVLIGAGDFVVEDDRPVDTYPDYFMNHFQGSGLDLQIGSQQGSTRSWAYYYYIKYHKNF